MFYASIVHLSAYLCKQLTTAPLQLVHINPVVEAFCCLPEFSEAVLLLPPLPLHPRVGRSRCPPVLISLLVMVELLVVEVVLIELLIVVVVVGLLVVGLVLINLLVVKVPIELLVVVGPQFVAVLVVLLVVVGLLVVNLLLVGLLVVKVLFELLVIGRLCRWGEACTLSLCRWGEACTLSLCHQGTISLHG